MSFGDILQDINLHIDQVGFASRVSEATPPKLAPKVMEYIAGGMSAPVDIPMGSVEKMEADFSIKGVNADVLSLWGIHPGAERQFSLRAVTVDSTGKQVPVRIQMTATVREIDHGTWKPGDADVSTKVSVTAHTYEYLRDGNQLVFVDAINCALIIGGKDQMAARKAALGI